MTREDLFAAIGAVSEERLARQEAASKRKGRILLRCGLAAAVVAALAASVFAIPAVRNALFGGKTELEKTGGVYGAEYGIEERYYDDSYGVNLDLTVSDDAPVFIETYYLPTELMENWSLCDGCFAVPDAVSFAWDNYGRGDYVLFEQRPARYYSNDINVPPGTQVSQTTVERDGLTLYRVEAAANEADGRGTLYIYWSDGCYVFKLQCPATLSEEELFAIVDSLAPIEDISRYCTPVTDYEPTYEPDEEASNPTFSRYDMPSYLPASYRLEYGYVENGSANFGWEQDITQSIQFGQYLWDSNADRYIDWERSVNKCPQEVAEIGGHTVTIFDESDSLCAYWEADEFDYCLSISKSTSYDARDELQKIIESVQPVEDISPYLMESSAK